MPEHCVDLTATLQTMDQRLDVTSSASHTPGGNKQRGGVPGRRGLMVAACLLIAACWLMPATVLAATFCVQSGADLETALLTAESNGANDTIKIVQGTYQGPFSYASTEERNLNIQGGYTAACATRQVNPINTVLNGTSSGAVLALESTAPGALLVDGLTVQNGQQGLRITTTGGQVTVSRNAIQQSGQRDSYAALAIDGASSVEMTDNTIQQNSWHGLELSGDVSVVTLHNNMIRENAGHGVKMSRVWQATLTSNTIHKNGTPHSSPLAGVDISSYSHTTLMHNTITYNTEGIGVDIAKSSRGRQANAVLIGNIVNHNSIGFRVRHFHRVILQKNVINFNGYTGVAISDTGARTNLSGNNIRLNGRRGFDLFDAGNVLLKNNLITGNGTPELFGGGGYITGVLFPRGPGKSVTLKNNVISKNNALEGGGVYIGGRPALVTMTNNTIHGNTATAAGGRIWLELYGNTDQADIYNNIIWANTAPQGAALFLENNRNGDSIRSPINLFNNAFAFSDIYRKRSFPIHSSNFNNVDPLFVNAASGDYHLQASSPLINQGNNAPFELPAMDKEGQPRIDGVAVDLGAYETND